MKILHTADWHIGQLFYEFDRSFEHESFLNWLILQIANQQIDVLLISGDVFDISNPSAHSIKLFYTFLSRASSKFPSLQIIIIAGNHDSASRLESPKPLLESFNVHIVGVVQKTPEGKVDYDKLLIPLKGKDGLSKAWCLAIPFLRLGDYPPALESQQKYADGVKNLYQEAYHYARHRVGPSLPIIALGHLHVQQAEVTELDHSERQIMGGVEAISTTAFHEDIRYVALGHIHKAQRLGGKEHIRYCGSPIPLSFSELNYKHQVITFELEEDGIHNLSPVEVPVCISLLRIPKVHQPLKTVLLELEKLPPQSIDVSGNRTSPPYLEVRVLIDEPQPGLRHKIESVLDGKFVRLAKIDAQYPGSQVKQDREETITEDKFNGLRPREVFRKAYQLQFQNAVPQSVQEIFDEVVTEVSQNNNA